MIKLPDPEELLNILPNSGNFLTLTRFLLMVSSLLVEVRYNTTFETKHETKVTNLIQLLEYLIPAPRPLLVTKTTHGNISGTKRGILDFLCDFYAFFYRTIQSLHRCVGHTA